MFIAKDYDLHLEAPACEPGAEYWNATAYFGDDISAAFPYLNAEWPTAIYDPAANQITCRFGDHAVALRAHEITISNLPDRDAAAVEMEQVVAAINRIWMDRENLTPLHTSRRRLVAMDIYHCLPGTNCRLCGQTSCFGLATKIAVGEADVQACTPLFEDEAYAAQRQSLLKMLAEATQRKLP